MSQIPGEPYAFSVRVFSLAGNLAGSVRVDLTSQEAGLMLGAVVRRSAVREVAPALAAALEAAMFAADARERELQQRLDGRTRYDAR